MNKSRCYLVRVYSEKFGTMTVVVTKSATFALEQMKLYQKRVRSLNSNWDVWIEGV